MCLANRTYGVLADFLEVTGALAPGHGKREADRAIARVFGIAASTARNWRRCRHQHVAHGTFERLVALCREASPTHAARLEFLDRLTGGGQSLRLAAERLVRHLADLAGGGSAWHIYDAPLTLAFSLDVSPEERAHWVERSSLLVERVLDAGLDHGDIPCLPELVRYSVHGWHHASRFDVRERSLEDAWSEAWLRYLNPIERALYHGDVRAMPALFSGRLREAAAHTASARDLLTHATAEDDLAAPVSRADARIMVDAVEAQVLACHRPGEDADDAFAARYEDRTADHPWVDSVRLGALGYIALTHREFARAASFLEAAGQRVDGWLERSNVPFGSSPHFALAGLARMREGAPAERVEASLRAALQRSLEHGIIVDQIASRRCLALYCREYGRRPEASHHDARADQLVDEHRLRPWDATLRRWLE